jgi:hypothetical protein
VKASRLFLFDEQLTLNQLADGVTDPFCSPTAHAGLN